MALTVTRLPTKPVLFHVDRREAQFKNGPVDLDAKRLAAFAERIRLGRQRLYPTRTAFCAVAKITRTTLRHLESGSQQPTQKTINGLAKALGITPSDLTGEERIDPGDPLLRDLRKEDYQIAQLFHHASTDARLHVRTYLQTDATRPEGARPGASFPAVDRRTGRDDRRAVASENRRTVPDDPIAQLGERILHRLASDPEYCVEMQERDALAQEDDRTAEKEKSKPASTKKKAAPTRRA